MVSTKTLLLKHYYRRQGKSTVKLYGWLDFKEAFSIVSGRGFLSVDLVDKSTV